MVFFLNTLIGFIALQHLGFLALEMFFWTQPLGQKIFKITPEFAQQSSALAANQGLYNGFLAAGLIWSLMTSDPNMGYQLKLFFTACVFVAGIYGWFTVSSTILYVQAFPALIALILTVLILKN